MRVIHLLRKFDPAEWGGTETAVQRLFDGLRQHGVTPVMYCPQIKRDEPENAHSETIQRAPLDRLHSGTPHPGPLPFRRGEGESAPTSGVAYVADHSATQNNQAGEPQHQTPSASANGGNGEIRRFKTFVPVWGLSRDEKRQFISLGGNLMSFGLLPALWREPDVALVHTHTLGRLGGIASAAARGRGLPLVVSIHGGLLDLPPAMKASLNETSHGGVEWGKLFGLVLQSRNLIHHADAVFACNWGEADLLRRAYPGKRIEIQSHGIVRGPYEQNQRAAAQEAFPQIHGKEVLLCAGRVDPVKNQGWLISQAQVILRRHPAAILVLAGACTNQAYGQELGRQINKLGLSEQILLTGALPPGDPRLIGLFQEARAVLLPSKSETFGVVLLEAWAAGTTVISSRTSGPSALIRHGENGWLFDLADPAAFHEAVNQTLHDPGLRSKLAENGRRLVQKEFDAASVGRKVKHLYEELIEAKHALRHSA